MAGGLQALTGLDQEGNGGGSPLDFDVVTEIWLADRAAYDRFLTASADPDTARRIAEDEENVFDRGATRMFVVEERGSGVPAA